MKHAVALIAVLFQMTHSKAAEVKDLDWLAFGDLRENIETCGCDPRTDLGGVVRIAKLVENERREHPSVNVFDLGNNILSPFVSSKSRFLQKALDHIKPDAQLMNFRDLKIVNEAKKKGYSLGNKVLSNQKSAAIGELNIPQYLETDQAIVFGFTWDPSIENLVEHWTPELVKTIRKRQETNKKQKVMLFSGPDKDLMKIAASGLFDLIVSSNTRKSDVPGFSEKEDPALLLRMSHPAFVRMVPLGGIGILRGGALQTNLSSLNALFSEGSTVSQTGKKQEVEVFSKLHLVSWLDSSFDGNSPVAAIMDSYQDEKSRKFQMQALKKTSRSTPSPFAGAEKCRSCHPSEYKIWKASAHSQAMETLISKRKNQDGNCVPCHVVGYDSPGGFISSELSQHLSGVQCENCHGPRAAHTENRSHNNKTDSSAKKAADTCQQCHHLPHSFDFTFPEYWKKIKHP